MQRAAALVLATVFTALCHTGDQRIIGGYGAFRYEFVAQRMQPPKDAVMLNARALVTDLVLSHPLLSCLSFRRCVAGSYS